MIKMLGSAIITTMELALTGLQIGRLALLGMRANFEESKAVQANGRLMLLEGLALLTAATEGHGSPVESHGNLRAIIRKNYARKEEMENERH
jgi:hypothetical protein